MSAKSILRKYTAAEYSRLQYDCISQPPRSHPQNCPTECPYGYDRAFCFPCYKRLLLKTRTCQRKKRKKHA